MSLTLFYNELTHGAAIGQITDKLVQTSKVLAEGEIGRWTHTVKIKSDPLEKKEKLFLYNRNSRKGVLGVLEKTGFSVLEKFEGGTLSTWSHIVSVGTLLFFYNQETGSGEIIATDPQPTKIEESGIITKPDLSGLAGNFASELEQANKTNQTTSQTQSQNFLSIATYNPGELGRWSHVVASGSFLLFYDKEKNTGRISKLANEPFSTIQDHALGAKASLTHLQELTKGSIGNWTHFVGGAPYLFFYNEDTSAGRVARLDETGLHVLKKFDEGTFGRWTHMAAGISLIKTSEADWNVQPIGPFEPSGKTIEPNGAAVLFYNIFNGAGALGLLWNDGFEKVDTFEAGSFGRWTSISDTSTFINPYDISEEPNGRFCGVPDRNVTTIDLQSFGSPGGRWSRGTLSVSINPAGAVFDSSLTSKTAVNVIESAFKQWQSVSDFFSFSFVPVGSSADIQVKFGGSQLDDRFGQPGGTLGSAGYPEAGNLQFDLAENWSKDKLLAVAVHEVGHLLGLSHSNTPGRTMYPMKIKKFGWIKTIDAESEDAIRALYGWQPQQKIGDRSTSHLATLSYTSVLYLTDPLKTPQMVWKGRDGDSAIYHSEYDGHQWSPQRLITGVGCSFSPALTQVPKPGFPNTDGLLMAWKGTGSDSGIYWTRYLGSGGWEGQRQIADVGCSAAPALANVNGRIFMAWKGVNNDTAIYWSIYDGAEGWSPQRKIDVFGTSDSPALAAYNGKLYMFWKGVPGDSHAYYSSLDIDNDPIWKPQRRIEFFVYETGGGEAVPIGTSGALSVTVRGSRIMLAWKGAGDDQAIWFCFFENEEFTGQVKVADVGTSIGPSIAHVGDRTFMAWKGVHGDSSIYWSVLSGR